MSTTCDIEGVIFPSTNPAGDCRGVLVRSRGCSDKSLLLLHAWWGVNDEIIQHAEEVAEETGFVVMVPDLYRGKVATDRETAGHYMDDLDWHGAVNDVQAAARYLQQRVSGKVGVSGFCMGGALCFLAAALVPEISSAAPFYGISKPHLADLTKVTVPIQGHFGDNDEVVGLSSPADYLALNDRLQAAGVPFELHVYPGVGHGFAHPSYPTYNKQATKLAFSRMYQFMDRTLE